MTSTPQRPWHGGVDFSNTHRSAFYATPPGSKTPVTGSVTTATSYASTAAPSFSTPSRPGATSFAFSRAGGGNIGNSGRKRTRGTSGFGSKIATSGGKRIPYGDALHTHTPRWSKPQQTSDRGNAWSTEVRLSATSPVVEHSLFERDYASPGTVSPPPMANSRYHLSTGFDTPTAAQANAYEDAAYFSYGTDSRFKRLADEGVGRHAYAFSAGLEGSTAEDLAGPLAMGRNENGSLRSRATSSARASSLEQSQFYGNLTHTPNGSPATWGVGKALLGAAAGVAGLVFHFCTAGAFRGFQAGGGQAWSMHDEHGAPFATEATGEKYIQDSTWHDSDFAQDDYIASPSPRRATKKMKSSHDDDGGLKSSWIMVDGAEDQSRCTTPQNGTPSRRASIVSTASPAALRQRSKPGTHKRRFGSSISGSLGGFEAKPASNAALRSPPTREALLKPSSVAKKRTSADGQAVDSPLGKEGEKLVRQQRRREREEDRELTNMNRRLEEMIRQGREALGTQYEVEMDGDIF